jgi:hypothetical protein
LAWTQEELEAIGGADEIELASRRPDCSLRNYVTIWIVRVGDEAYVRSAYGYENPWFQRALTAGQGRIRAGELELDVAFEAAPDPNPAVDAAYHAKYDRYGARMVGTVVSPDATRSTLRVQAT